MGKENKNRRGRKRNCMRGKIVRKRRDLKNKWDREARKQKKDRRFNRLDMSAHYTSCSWSLKESIGFLLILHHGLLTYSGYYGAEVAWVLFSPWPHCVLTTARISTAEQMPTQSHCTWSNSVHPYCMLWVIEVCIAVLASTQWLCVLTAEKNGQLMFKQCKCYTQYGLFLFSFSQ